MNEKKFAIERKDEIIELVNRKGKVTVNELATLFGVSGETLRKDLLELEQQGKLIRTHGGAVSNLRKKIAEPLSKRKNVFAKQKQELASYAVSFISDSDIIFIDEGSTATELARILAQKNLNITVVTHNFDAFMALAGKETIKLIMCGGDFDREERVFVGPMTREMIKNMHVDKAFICPAAVSLEFGISDFDTLQRMVEIQREVMKRTNQIFMLADSGKFETNAFIKVCDITKDMIFITDRGIDQQVCDLYKKNQITIISGDES